MRRTIPSLKASRSFVVGSSLRESLAQLEAQQAGILLGRPSCEPGLAKEAYGTTERDEEEEAARRAQGEGTQDGRAQGERTQGERTQGERTQGERTEGERA
jgi:hypothetical protein